MACEFCRQVGLHDCRCPLYDKRPVVVCNICGEGIYDGEEYIENCLEKVAHYNCLVATRDTLDWLGYAVKEMEEK